MPHITPSLSRIDPDIVTFICIIVALVNEDCWQGDIQFVKESAEGWKQLEDGRHICPACHTHEDDDSLTLKTGEVIPVDDWLCL